MYTLNIYLYWNKALFTFKTALYPVLWGKVVRYAVLDTIVRSGYRMQNHMKQSNILENFLRKGTLRAIRLSIRTYK